MIASSFRLVRPSTRGRSPLRRQYPTISAKAPAKGPNHAWRREQSRCGKISKGQDPHKRSDALERQRGALADADAHRGKSITPAAPLQFQRDGAGDAGPGHAERVAERDRPAVWIDVFRVVRQPEPAQAGERLRGECLVELEDVETGRLKAEPLAESLDRRDRAAAHHPRRDAAAGEGQHLADS